MLHPVFDSIFVINEILWYLLKVQGPSLKITVYVYRAKVLSVDEPDTGP